MILKYCKTLFTHKPLIKYLVLFICFWILVYKFKHITPPPEYVSNGRALEAPLFESPGDLGVAVVHDKSEQHKVDEAYRLYGFNQYVSDKISLNRRLPDVRPKACADTIYNIPYVKVSVIVVFYEEGRSTLLRTVTSVINRTPKNILHEVILVDDHSLMEHLKEPLDKYAAGTNGLVKVLRLHTHNGLIIARIAGADIATGDYLVFLDSHCEANTGWIEPLLQPILEDYRTVTCPTIDGIEHDTFRYSKYGGENGETARGTFSWMFHYKERPPTAEMRRSKTFKADNIPSPVMAGGLFAISSKWWKELGKYDPGMYVWGGEQYELSFKLWMCGGKMYNVACSRVGHVYRGPGMFRSDQGLNSRHPNSVWVNYRRVAEVWMDEYKHFLFVRRPQVAEALDYRDGIDERIKLRNSLKCKSFEWYLRNVVNDTLLTAYEPDRAWDKIKTFDSKLCLKLESNPLRVSQCSAGTKLRWTWINEIREEEHCLQVNDDKLVWNWCHENKKDQKFIYDTSNSFIVYPGPPQKCLSYNQNNQLILEVCDQTKDSQKWIVKFKDLSIPEPWSIHAIHPPREP